MDEPLEEEEFVFEENLGVGPTSYQFLHSIVANDANGALSRFELFKKRQNLDALLTASPEQLKVMQIEVAELLQLVNFCEAQYLQVVKETEQRLSDVEKFIAFATDQLHSPLPCKNLKDNLARSREYIHSFREDFISYGEPWVKWVRNSPGPFLIGEDLVDLVLYFQGLNNRSKYMLEEFKKIDTALKN